MTFDGVRVCRAAPVTDGGVAREHPRAQQREPSDGAQARRADDGGGLRRGGRCRDNQLQCDQCRRAVRAVVEHRQCDGDRSPSGAIATSGPSGTAGRESTRAVCVKGVLMFPPLLDDQPAAVFGTAAQHASTRVPIAAPTDTVGDLLAGLRGQRFETADVVAVCAGPTLVGLLTIERVFAARADDLVSDVMDPDPPTIAPGTNQERAAWEAVHHGEPGLAVVDERGRFRGLIPPQRMLAVLLAEHDQDIARLSGYLHSAREARTASTEPVARRLWHRLPWLLVGLAGALLSAAAVGLFEEQLARQVLIALFVPGVVYIADAVGTQTEALIIRGLSVGIGVLRVAVREMVTGVALGVLLAALAFPLIWAIWGLGDLALAVSVAVLAASSIATVVAMALPWLFTKLGKDPAFGSGPLATVVQDLLSVLIYFLAATSITV